MRTVFSICGILVLFGAMTTLVLGEDTPEAAATRKMLKTKVKEVKYVEQRLEDVMDDLKDSVKGFRYKLDSKGGVSRNQKVSFTGKNKTVAEILDGLFSKNNLGYYIISGPKDAYNGLIFVKSNSKERGYKKDEEPKKDK